MSGFGCKRIDFQQENCLLFSVVICSKDRCLVISELTSTFATFYSGKAQPEVSFRCHSFLLFFVSQLAMHACVVRA